MNKIMFDVSKISIFNWILRFIVHFSISFFFPFNPSSSYAAPFKDFRVSMSASRFKIYWSLSNGSQRALILINTIGLSFYEKNKNSFIWITSMV